MNRIAAAVVVLAGSVQFSIGCFGMGVTNWSGPTVVLAATGLVIILNGLTAMLLLRSNA